MRKQWPFKLICLSTANAAPESRCTPQVPHLRNRLECAGRARARGILKINNKTPGGASIPIGHIFAYCNLTALYFAQARAKLSSAELVLLKSDGLDRIKTSQIIQTRRNLLLCAIPMRFDRTKS